MNVHYTVYKEYALAATESRLRSSVRELIDDTAETGPHRARKDYSGALADNEFYLKRKTAGSISLTEVLGRYAYANDKLIVQTWTRLRPLVNWLLILGFPMQFLFLSMLVLHWQKPCYFVGVIAVADVGMYFLLILLVREDAREFRKVLTGATEG